MRRWLLLLLLLRRLLVWRLLRRLLHAPCARAHSRRVDVLLMRKKSTVHATDTNWLWRARWCSYTCATARAAFSASMTSRCAS